MLSTLLLFACFEATTAPPPPPRAVTVVRGDTLSALAATHGVSVDELMRLNGLDDDRIEVGQVLLLETAESAASDVRPRLPSPTPPRRPRRGPSPPAEIAAPPPPVANGPTLPSLRAPAARPCLPPPSDEGLGEYGMRAATGLSHADAAAAMRAALDRLSPCLRGLTSPPTAALDLSIDVACSGRVTDVRVDAQGDWPDEQTACLVAGIRYASFPAHDRPDGDTFRYPLRMQ